MLLKKLLHGTMLIGALLSLSALAWAQDRPVQIIGGDEEQVRALLSRMFSVEMFSMSASETQPAIYVAAPPDELPFDVPLPEGTVVIGAMVDVYMANNGQLYLDVPGTMQEIEAFFAQAMQDAGFSPAQMQRSAGFTSGSFNNRAYCSADNQLLINLLIGEAREGGLAPVNLGWQEAYPGSCEADPRMMGGIPAVLPTLQMPSGARVTTAGYGGGGDQAQSTATIVTSLSAGEIAEAVAEQLTAEGWTQLGSETGDILAVSVWTITDENARAWRGFLAIIASDEDTLTALFQVNRSR